MPAFVHDRLASLVPFMPANAGALNAMTNT